MEIEKIGAIRGREITDLDYVGLSLFPLTGLKTLSLEGKRKVWRTCKVCWISFEKKAKDTMEYLKAVVVFTDFNHVSQNRPFL